MTAVSLRPGPPLLDYVEELWLYELPPAEHRFERVVPSGRMQLLINLRDDALDSFDAQGAPVDSFRGPLLCGAYAEPVVIATAQLGCIMGASLRANGGGALLGLAAGTLRDVHVPLDAVWGAEVRSLAEQLREVKAPKARLERFAALLTRHAIAARARHPAVAYALGELDRIPHATSVAAITREVGLSPRRLGQLFSEQVGLTPKLYGRIRRFRGVLERIHGRDHVDWCQVALACGYYDQSHLIRDFQELAATTPTAYLKARPAFASHIPIA